MTTTQTPQASAYHAAKTRATNLENAQKWLRRATKTCFALSAIGIAVGVTAKLTTQPSKAAIPTIIQLDKVYAGDMALEQTYHPVQKSVTVRSGSEQKAMAIFPGTNITMRLDREAKVYNDDLNQVIARMDQIQDKLEKSPQYSAYVAEQHKR